VKGCELMNAFVIEELINEYGTAVYGFCRRLAVNPYDMDDLYQQTFLKALELADKIDKYNNPKAFLISLSVSIWKNNIRKNVRHEQIAPTLPFDEMDEEVIGSEFDTEKVVIEKSLYNEVDKIINSFDSKFRIPLILFYNAELGIEEIAKICSCPEGTVKSRLHKARELVKKKLEELGYGSDK
jgi:RNA polymerase sigma-70 factor (ECF subfamily)